MLFENFFMLTWCTIKDPWTYVLLKCLIYIPNSPSKTGNSDLTLPFPVPQDLLSRGTGTHTKVKRHPLSFLFLDKRGGISFPSSREPFGRCKEDQNFVGCIPGPSEWLEPEETLGLCENSNKISGLGMCPILRRRLRTCS